MYKEHRLHPAGRAHLVDLNDQRVSVVGENSDLQKEIRGNAQQKQRGGGGEGGGGGGASSSLEEESFRLWVKKGNPTGFLDRNDEAEVDGWGREEKKKRFSSMNRGERKTVALFLLRHIVSLVEGEGAPEGIDFNFVQPILEEDGSVDFEAAEEGEKMQVEAAVQTEVAIEERGARDSEDVAMVDRSNMYEDLSGYEDEDEAPVVVVPPITKKQAAPRPAEKAGRKSRPAKIPPQKASPNSKLAKGSPETRGRYYTGCSSERDYGGHIGSLEVTSPFPATCISRDLVPRESVSYNQRLGIVTSSAVVLLDRKLAVGSHLKMRGRWLPIEAYEFERGKKRVDLRSDQQGAFTLSGISHHNAVLWVCAGLL
ncbi:hypothetical protein BGX38DRAFT_1143027 [Terfezia claveryi]|nr:hypothetical protein BGX38DRAFT_1143027 [Terfezia claveryi]